MPPSALAAGRSETFTRIKSPQAPALSQYVGTLALAPPAFPMTFPGVLTTSWSVFAAAVVQVGLFQWQ